MWKISPHKRKNKQKLRKKIVQTKEEEQKTTSANQENGMKNKAL